MEVSMVVSTWNTWGNLAKKKETRNTYDYENTLVLFSIELQQSLVFMVQQCDSIIKTINFLVTKERNVEEIKNLTKYYIRV